jgi:hypothetical protein
MSISFIFYGAIDVYRIADGICLRRLGGIMGQVPILLNLNGQDRVAEPYRTADR